MANFDLRKFLNENKLTRASKPLLKENLADTRMEAEGDARIFHKDLVTKYGFDAVADALEAAYDNAEEGGMGYENIADTFKMDNSMLIDMIEDSLAEGIATNSKTLTEAAKKPTIKILKDLFYFDKLGSLGAIDDAKLVFKKDTLVDDDTTHDDSEYEMITSSKRLEKGVDYEVTAAGGMNESADSDEILEVINQLIEMGEEGQTALNILAKIPAWQAIVDRAVEM